MSESEETTELKKGTVTAAPVAVDVPVDLPVNVIENPDVEEAKEEEEEEQEEQEQQEQATKKDYDPMKVLELGDRVIIDSEKYGLQWGTVYYRDNDLLRLKPDMGNTLIDYPRDYDKEEVIDKFQDDLDVKVSYIMKKRKHPDFVRQQDFQVDQSLVGVDSNGKQTAFYKITKVSETKDYIVMYNIDDEDEEVKLRFNFYGIPQDAPFQVLRIVAPPGVDLKEEAEKARTAAAEAIGVPVTAPVFESEGQEGEEDEAVLAGDEFEIEDEGFIVVPQEDVLKEVTASRRIIPENLQKADAINDFLNMFTPADRKNPRIIRTQRVLVETLHHMKRAITEYNSNGTIKGPKSPSASTLYELLTKADVPMGRAVLDIDKRLFQTKLEEREAGDHYYIQNDPIENSSDAKSAFASSVFQTSSGYTKQDTFYTDEQAAYEQERPWRAGKLEGPPFDVRKDMQIFRRIVPDFDESVLQGYEALPEIDRKPKNGELPRLPDIGTLPYGLETALTTTYRKGQKGQKTVLLEDEAAPLNYYMLFPQETATLIGTKRSGSLALDMVRSKEPMKLLVDILRDLTPIQEVNTATGIVLLKVEGGNLSANIPLTDYLEGLVLVGTGIGDLLIDLGNYGLNQLEFTTAIVNVLNAKIAIYQGQLKTVLNEMRLAIPQIPPAAPNPMLPIETTNILDAFLREGDNPLLINAIKTFEAQNPTLKLSDIARVAYLLKYFGDYWQVVIGKQVGLIAEERASTMKSIQLERIQHDEIIKRNKANRGAPPQPNPCEHVAKLTAIRRIKDEPERYAALTKFLAHYQGARREDNWITCNVCSKELVCVHERLLIKAFLNPLEKEVVFKELNLKFSGGVFQGHYICRSCGQPIQEIGYDTNLQFDEKGRPMIGRAVLEDKDALTAQDIERVLSLPLKKSDEYEFGNANQTAYYKIIRELAERVGIYMDRKNYKKIIKNLETLMDLYPTRDEFVASEKKAKKKADAKGEKYTKREYDVIIAKQTILNAAILLLYQIQAHIPDLVPQYALPGCDAGFGGYPLEESKENIQGLTYMACAIGSIQRDDVPWVTAQLYKPAKGGKKEDQIQKILAQMKGPLEDIKQNLQGLEGRLVEKRIWKTEQLGVRAATKRLQDIVPSSFLPELVLPTVAAAAAEPVTESAMDARAVAKAWIRNAHALAREYSKPVRGSPYMDITCCKTSVTVPGAFWLDKANLSPVPLGTRSLNILQRAPAQQFHFEERVPEVLVAEIPKDLTYRLFLSVCYKGPRFGLPHEPGYTNLCHSCGFQFPAHPSIVDPDEAREAISKQKVDTNLETFQTLLTSVQNHNHVDPHSLGEPEPWQITMEAVRDLPHPPLDEWNELFRRAIRGLNKLKANGTDTPDNIAEVLGNLANAASDAANYVKSVFATKMEKKNLKVTDDLLDMIATLPWHNFIQVLETYFLKVCKNFLYQYDSDRLQFSNPKLSSITISDIELALAIDNSILNKFKEDFFTRDKRLAQLKMMKFVLQLTDIVRFKNRLRAAYFVGGKKTFEYIQKCFFYGPLQDLFNPDDIPFEDEDDAIRSALPEYRDVPDEEEAEEEEEEEESSNPKGKKGIAAISDTSISLLVKIINYTIANFNKYKLGYNDEQLKQILESRAEKEKQGMLSALDDMSDEQRRIYTLQMKLGIGRFGVNVRKDIIGYSKDQVELEARLNKEAGIVTSLSGPDFRDEMVNEGFEGEEDDLNQGDEELNEFEQGYGDDNQDYGEFANDDE